MPHLSLRLLGSMQLTLNGAPLIELTSAKGRLLLVYLAVEAQNPHTRASLASRLWPDRPDSAARNSLRQTLYQLRQALPPADPPFLLVTPNTIQFNTHSDHWLDMAVFEDLLAASHRHLHPRLDICEPCMKRLEQAIALYRDDFLAGFPVASSLPFEEWVLLRQESLHMAALFTLETLTTYHEQRRDFEQAMFFLRREIEMEPWRERAHRRLMGMLAQSGRRPEALQQYETCRLILANKLGSEPVPETTALHQYILAGSTRPGLQSIPNPYKGLNPFGEEDAPVFFGRDPFTGRLMDAIRQQPVVAVIGPSGSSKSSAVFAGLLPCLRKTDQWLICHFRPGNRPFEALAAALTPLLETQTGPAGQMLLARGLAESWRRSQATLSDAVERIVAAGAGQTPHLSGNSAAPNTTAGQAPAHRAQSRLLILIDQFEELFRLCPDPAERAAFIDLLLQPRQRFASSSQGTPFCTVLLTLRADFLGLALANRPLADALQEGMLILGPMSPDELVQAIEMPAARQGISFEAGLVQRILADLGDEPGNLSLLQFALTALWRRQAAGMLLTHEAYDAIGRIGGALAGYAESLHRGFAVSEQRVARQVFPQLVRAGKRTQDTRRRASRAEFDDQGWRIIQRLADARLVVTSTDLSGHATAELIHEALIDDWERLRGWLDEERSFCIWQQQLRDSLDQWIASGEEENDLLRGNALAQAEAWLAVSREYLNGRQQAYIEASLALRAKEQAEAEAQRERELTWTSLCCDCTRFTTFARDPVFGANYCPLMGNS